MFTFNKNDAAPRSRQSSVDCPITSTSSSASTSDTWTSQCSANNSYGTTLSSEQRPRAYSHRRSSVFNLRTRSDTATSTTSSFMSLSPPGTGSYETSQPGSPLLLRQSASQSQLDPLVPRKSLFRGRKGKRLSESAGDVEYEATATGEKRTSVLRKGTKWHNRSDSSSKC
jgi:hypothetical protein